MSDYSVCKRDGRWRVYQDDTWTDTFDTLDEAHDWASQCAVADVLYEPGGLTRMTLMCQLEQLILCWLAGWVSVVRVNDVR